MIGNCFLSSKDKKDLLVDVRKETGTELKPMYVQKDP
jgi:hypothetical protein